MEGERMGKEMGNSRSEGRWGFAEPMSN